MSNNPGFQHTFDELYEPADGKDYNWTNGLFSGWLSNVPVCMVCVKASLCCFSCSRGYLTAKAGGNFWPSCLMNTLGCGLGDCSHNIVARRSVRHQHGIQGTIVEDYCQLACCPACSAAQELNQLGVTTDMVKSDYRNRKTMASTTPLETSAAPTPVQTAPVQDNMN
ncbi:hypothetical protein FOL47_011203 [Perkinsus chesapeaki]|uniref:Uncharacterized protein n=1 Tax=Perkinsus chesapeaki TaxID=330153 RepID=A0A7J6MN02_PERCH|nr:hypothetical protein FOL47_011203 [Perkinsus chesapeaki]